MLLRFSPGSQHTEASEFQQQLLGACVLKLHAGFRTLAGAFQTQHAASAKSLVLNVASHAKRSTLGGEAFGLRG